MKYGAVRKLCPRFYPATARYDEVPENKLTKALLPTLKSQLSVCQRTVEDAYANNEFMETHPLTTLRMTYREVW